MLIAGQRFSGSLGSHLGIGVGARCVALKTTTTNPMKTNFHTKMCSMLTALAILLIAPVRFACAVNLVTNGDFETGDFTGWTVTGTNINVLHGPGPDTTFGAFFGANVSGFSTISQTFATTPGAFYNLTFFYQVTNLGTPFPANNAFDVLWNGASIGGGLFPQTNVSPGSITPNFIEQATGTSTTLTFEGFNQQSVDFLDNVSVTVPDTGSTFGLLALALAVLFGASRFRALRLA